MSNPQPSMCLNPEGRARAILLVLGERPHVIEETARLRPLIEQHVDIVLQDDDFSADLSRIEADLGRSSWEAMVRFSERSNRWATNSCQFSG